MFLTCEHGWLYHWATLSLYVQGADGGYWIPLRGGYWLLEDCTSVHTISMCSRFISYVQTKEKKAVIEGDATCRLWSFALKSEVCAEFCFCSKK